jgi:hypothetical protein
VRAAGRWLLLGWLAAALLVLGMDGQLPEYLAGAGCGSLAVLGAAALVRWHRRPSRYCRPALPESYRVADDLRRPLAEVVVAAEREAGDERAGERGGQEPRHIPGGDA